MDQTKSACPAGGHSPSINQQQLLRPTSIPGPRPTLGPLPQPISASNKPIIMSAPAVKLATPSPNTQAPKVSGPPTAMPASNSPSKAMVPLGPFPVSNAANPSATKPTPSVNHSTPAQVPVAPKLAPIPTTNLNAIPKTETTTSQARPVSNVQALVTATKSAPPTANSNRSQTAGNTQPLKVTPATVSPAKVQSTTQSQSQLAEKKLGQSPVKTSAVKPAPKAAALVNHAGPVTATKSELKLETKPVPAPPLTLSPPSAPQNSAASDKVESDMTAMKRKRGTKVGAAKVTQPASDGADQRSKRPRVQTQPYQSPIPQATFTAKALKSTPAKPPPEETLTVFFRGEFLAVRNAEGSFYICQAMQNVHKSSRKIRIRWLSQVEEQDSNKDMYSPDFYDHTDFECILTNLNMERIDKNIYRLPVEELKRTENILKRAIDVEKGVSEKPSVSEEHPDGLDVSLYKDESQLKKRKTPKKKEMKRKKLEDSSSGNRIGDSGNDSECKVEKPPIQKTAKVASPKKTEAKVEATNQKTPVRPKGSLKILESEENFSRVLVCPKPQPKPPMITKAKKEKEKKKSGKKDKKKSGKKA